LARLDAELTDVQFEQLADPAMEALRSTFPAARSLPLLRVLAARRIGRVILEYLDVSRMEVQVEPCT
jgi:hypothetical protein